ncbi:MAG: hypothetical protein ACOX87_12565 [Chloroflexota bacterium]
MTEAIQRFADALKLEHHPTCLINQVELLAVRERQHYPVFMSLFDSKSLLKMYGQELCHVRPPDF